MVPILDRASAQCYFLWATNHLETLAEVAADYPEASIVATRHVRVVATAPLPAIETAEHVTQQFNFLSTACHEESLFTSATAVRRQVLIDVGALGFRLWRGRRNVVSIGPRLSDGALKSVYELLYLANRWVS